jgi:Flp pilus assembly protein TadB
MNATTQTPGLGHQLGRAVRRLAGKYNAFESRMARRAGDAFPAIGVKVFRALFLILKIVVFLALFAVTAYIALVLLAFFVIVAVMRIPHPVDVPGYGDIGDPTHRQHYPGHSHYADDQWF